MVVSNANNTQRIGTTPIKMVGREGENIICFDLFATGYMVNVRTLKRSAAPSPNIPRQAKLRKKRFFFSINEMVASWRALAKRYVGAYVLDESLPQSQNTSPC